MHAKIIMSFNLIIKINADDGSSFFKKLLLVFPITFVLEFTLTFKTPRTHQADDYNFTRRHNCDPTSTTLARFLEGAPCNPMRKSRISLTRFLLTLVQGRDIVETTTKRRHSKFSNEIKTLSLSY